ncbi:MAG TPA: hypothetical protein VHX66_01660 [Solirubrobacteraceae bacterium]|nr:hypothetical protein [Solirubrobacteraceae bacterium]
MSTPSDRLMPSQQGAAIDLPENPPPPRLSLVRVLIALAVIVGIAGSATYAVGRQDVKGTRGSSPRFAPYVDVTLTPTYPFQNPTVNPVQRVVLGFVVAQPSQPCSPSWGGAYTPAQAETAMNLDQRINQVREQGGVAVISFGGATNSELAVGCDGVAQLAAAYRGVLTRYSSTDADFDIEGDALADAAANQRRAEAVALVQQQFARHGKHLNVWLTLPVSPGGLTRAGLGAVRAMVAAGVKLTGVNVLAMDYQPAPHGGARMLATVESSLQHANAQLQSTGVARSSAEAWKRLGVTVMIGRNDVAGETFTLADARGLAAFVNSNGIAQVSMWSLNRDSECGGAFVAVGVLSNTCSGVKQTTLEFTHVFLALPGTVTASGAATAPAWAPPSTTPDNPAKSPYPVWQATASYPGGYKVVWHHAVYQALWFSQSAAPDTPGSNGSPSPWLLLGPVLPGEHPQKPTLLASGVTQKWLSNGVYRAGARVLFGGLPFEAKWYSQGSTPQTSLPASSSSPWQPLFTLPGEPSS